MKSRIMVGMALLACLGASGCGKRADAVALPAPESAPSSVVAVPTNSALGAGWAGPGAQAGTESPLSGTTEAHRRSTLTPKVSSSITKVYVREGDRVKAGQLLVSMDTRDFALRTEQAQATLEAAKVAVDSAQLDWNRTKGLVEEKAVPQAQFDQMDARLKGAKANLAQAETAVAMGKKSLGDSSIAAPFNAIVVKRQINEGEYAAMMPPTPLLTIEETDPIDLRIQVPSTQMETVHVGDAVRVRFPANKTEVTGKIARIVPANDPRTRTFSAIVELPNPDGAIRTGLYAEVDPTSKAPAAADSSPRKLTVPTKSASAPAITRSAQ